MSLVDMLPERIRTPCLRILDKYRLSSPDRVYGRPYFEKRIQGDWREDARRMASFLFDRFEPASVADFGCGPGAYLREFKELGVSETLGVEGAQAALDVAVVEDIVKADLREPFHTERNFDLVLCIEVAEHVHEKHEGVLLSSLVDALDMGSILVLSAAPPGQDGRHHVNLKPHDYWINCVETMGPSYLEKETESVRRGLKDVLNLRTQVPDNLLVFRTGGQRGDHQNQLEMSKG